MLNFRYTVRRFASRMDLQRAAFNFATAVVLSLTVAIAHAERVSYSFETNLEPPFPGASTLTLFKVSGIPVDAPATGTFTYDTATVGVGSNPTVYPQSIDSGLTLNIGDTLRLSAKDFIVRISNDFQLSMEPKETVDILTVVFDTISAPATPLLVNGVPWTSTDRNYIKVQFRYPSDTFHDTSLPIGPPMVEQVPTDHPYSIVGDSNLNNSPFTVGSVLRMGDYNGDGAISTIDYGEWRNEFGCSQPMSCSADGNQDGVVNAADYVIWRDAIISNGLGIQQLAVPEPSAFVLCNLLWIVRASFSRGKRTT